MSKFLPHHIRSTRLNSLGIPGTFWNHEGGLAYARDDRTTLLSMAACCLFGEPQFYGDSTGKVIDLVRKVAASDPEWTVKFAVFLREKLHLRSVSHWVLAAASAMPGAGPSVARAFPRVALRPDDLLEIAALLKDRNFEITQHIPASIRRAIAGLLLSLDERDIIKYRRARSFGLRHLVGICHPKPRSPREAFLLRYIVHDDAWESLPEDARREFPTIAAFEAIRRGEDDPDLLARAAAVGVPWEVIVPRFGSRRKVWRELVPHLPIMALVRNLRNLHRSRCLASSGVRSIVRRKLADPETVRNSRLLPFRWLSAHNTMKRLDAEVARWIEGAMHLSVDNLPRLPGTTIIACDNSGSMDMYASGYSSVRLKDIAALLGAAAHRTCERSAVYVFADDAARVHFRSEGVLRRAEEVAGTDVGGATYAFKVLVKLLVGEISADRILFFTDMQIYGEERFRFREEEHFAMLLRTYRERVSPGVRTYIFNLAAYEHFMTPADDLGVTYFSGWSEGLLRYIAVEEEGGISSLVERVERIEL